jgi:ketosteroid isomerase-like protein
MASENVEIVRRAFACFDRRDIDGFLGFLDEDVDWRVSGYLTGDRNLHGKEAVHRWLIRVASLQASGEEVRLFQDEYRDLDERTVLVLGSGRIERKQNPLEEQLGWIWRIEGGKVVLMEDFLSQKEALDAAAKLTGSPQE